VLVLPALLAPMTLILLVGQAPPPPATPTPTPVDAPDDKDKNQQRPIVASNQPKASPKTHRWIDWQTGTVETRYRLIETSDGLTTNDQLQHKQVLKAGFKFDPAGRYSLQAGASSGANITSTWDNIGPGTGDPTWNFNLRQLYLQAAPWNGFEAQWGGTTVARGEHTEITSFDNDNYLMAGRVSVRRREQLYLDELSVTVGYFGDTTAPNVFRRFDRWDEHNYTQVLAARKFGRHVSASADWTSLDGISTLRQAVRIATKDWLPLDLIRFENYQRVEGNTGYGFAVTAERMVHPRVTIGGGVAAIDDASFPYNGDRYQRGKRVFVEPRFTVLPDLTFSLFYTEAFDNDFTIPNERRFDAVLHYNVLRGLQRIGAW
jgi:hypothetical protein